MWSVWSERVDVYLGTGLLMVQRPAAPLWISEPPATLPLADVLRQVDQALERASGKPWRLRVHLSAALCPPVAFEVPAGVRRHQELLAIAQASAAQAWAMSIEQTPEIVCSLDARHQGLAAAMLTGTHQMITQWAKEHQGRLISLQPLWAAATRAKVCRGNQAHSMAVLEPDALTVLELKQQGAVRAMSWPGQHDADEAATRLAEASAQAGNTDQTNGVAMAFGPKTVEAVWPHGPPVWRSYWSELP